MSIFILDTDGMNEIGKNIFNSSQELLTLSEIIASYSVDTDMFDFTSAKNTISENINKMQIKTSNIAQVISYAADTHTSVQKSLKCQASEGLVFKSDNASAVTTKITNSPRKPYSTPANAQPTSSSRTTYSASMTTQATTPFVNNSNSLNTNELQEQSTFVNYYQKDYSELTNNTSVLTAGGASTAIAMILTAINKKEIAPVETTKWGLDNKADIPNAQGEITYFDSISKAYGIQCEEMDLTKENILKNISEGKYMIISMDEGNLGNKGKYVVITGITEDGKIKIADPNSVDNSEKFWDLSIFLDDGIKLWGFSKPVEKNS